MHFFVDFFVPGCGIKFSLRCVALLYYCKKGNKVKKRYTIGFLSSGVRHSLFIIA